MGDEEGRLLWTGKGGGAYARQQGTGLLGIGKGTGKHAGRQGMGLLGTDEGTGANVYLDSCSLS